MRACVECCAAACAVQTVQVHAREHQAQPGSQHPSSEQLPRDPPPSPRRKAVHLAVAPAFFPLTIDGMSASTNPFAAAALKAQTGDENDEHASSHPPTNPFITSQPPAAASPPSSTNPFQAQPVSPTRGATSIAGLPSQTNGSTFGYQSSSYAADGGELNGYSIPHQTAAVDPAQNANSADFISQSLSGLDFGAGATSAPEPAPSQPANNPFTSTHTDHRVPPEAVSSQEPFLSHPSPPMTTVYAPPPGPPPGHPDALREQQGLSTTDNRSDDADQSAIKQVNQMEADEAYARKMWAREEERQRRREQRYRQGEQEGAVDRQRQKQRQRSYDPELAAVGGAPAPHPSGTPGPAIDPQAPLPPPPSRDPNEERQWNTKEIYWRGRSQRIIVQNENGPCSLIALCNVLLMRGTVQITPEDRPAASYSYLSSLLGEHLIDVIPSNPGEALDLEAALSILPQTQYGLDVNVKFSSIDGFAVNAEDSTKLADLPDSSAAGSSSAAAAVAAPSSTTDKTKQRGELALFRLCNVPLIHGWLADPSDAETWAAVVERTGDYDKALDRVVAGDELTKGLIVEGNDAESSSQAAQAMEQLSSEERVIVNDALLIRRFLESTATQLTYPGLYALSTSLERGSLYALFRNSHLSVLYRPTEEELLQAAAGATEMHDQPQLYQLVTDSTLENEDAIVWESVEDVDGSASRFYDGKFRPAHVQQDFVGRTHDRDPDQVAEDADFAYAQQLQEQEHRRAERHRRTADVHRRRPQQQVHPGSGAQGSAGSGNLIARMLANRKTSKHAPNAVAPGQSMNTTVAGQYAHPGRNDQRPADTYAGDQTGPHRTDGTGFGEEIPQREKKWWKKVF